jgi:hypothetical protein
MPSHQINNSRAPACIVLLIVAVAIGLCVAKTSSYKIQPPPAAYRHGR